MATDFKALATRYVLEDDEAELHRTAGEAARALQDLRTDPPAMRRAVGEWAASIADWVVRPHASLDGTDASEGGDNDNIILRAKALSFLEQTLEAMGPEDLRGGQVEQLVLFFCSTFRHDIRAGVLPATRALSQLMAMRAFKPKLGGDIVSGILAIGDDFPLQTAATRHQVYQILEVLVENPVAASELQSRYGEGPGFATELIRLCQQERDPRCLMKWFAILRTMLDQYPVSPDVTQKAFEFFSSYFPISLKNSTGDVTVSDLKLALRRCFASTYRLAPLAFPFLLKKLDQGEAVTVSVKVDILATMKMCVDDYANVPASIVPFAGQIWNSLKYEVRNGEVKETIDATLAVISSIAKKLDGTSKQKLGRKDLEDFTDVVRADCLDDLQNPSYTKQAGSLLVSAMASGVRAFSLLQPAARQTLIRNVQQPKSAAHVRDSIFVINKIMEARGRLVGQHPNWLAEDWDCAMLEPFDLGEDTLSAVYLGLWRENMTERPTKEQADILKESMQGLAVLIGQKSARKDRTLRRACSDARCREIFSLLSYRIVNGLSIGSANDSNIIDELQEEASGALKLCVVEHPAGFGEIVGQALAVIKGRDWQRPSQRALATLQNLLSRLADIGCSSVPDSSDWPPLTNLIAFTGTVLVLLHHWLGSGADFEVCRLGLRGIRSGLDKFWNAYSRKGVNHASGSRPLTADRSQVPGLARALIDTYPRLDEGQVDAFNPAKVREAMRPGHGTASLVPDYQALCLAIVSQLYRRATAVLVPPDGASDEKLLCLSHDFRSHPMETNFQDYYLQALAALATFVTRALPEETQASLQLEREAFLLFRLEVAPEQIWSPADGGKTNVLSVGILQGLWPTRVTEVCKTGAFSPSTVAGIVPGEQSTSALADEARDRVAFILANKYRDGRGTADPAHIVWSNVISYLRDRLSDAALRAMPLVEFNRLMWLTAGAIARRDWQIEDLAPAIRSVPARAGDSGEQMARAMEVLVAPKTWYGQDDHAVIKPTFRHWAYLVLVQPVLKEAYPLREASPATISHAVYVLAMVQHLSFDMYEVDAELIARLAISGIQKFVSYYDLEAAFRILQAILDKDKDILQSHVKAVIDATYDVYSRAARTRSPGQKDAGLPRRFYRAGSPSTCRKLALELIGSLPGKFEGRHLLPYHSNMLRGLGRAAGDPVREVRAAALEARKAWSRVV